MMNFFLFPSWLMTLLAFATALVVSWSAVPPIIAVSRAKKLYDEPNARKSHSTSTPMLGGIAIFSAFSLSFLIFSGQQIYRERAFIEAAFLIIFLLGMKDDIFVLAPLKKLAAQIVAALIVVVPANIQITNLHGFLGIQHISPTIGIPLSFFVIIVIINAYNLIDGIDGLAGSVGNVTALTFGIWFMEVGDFQYAIMAFALAGALMGFLRYNLSSGANKIFMGDTGSLLMGFVLGIIAIRFNEDNINPLMNHHIASAPAVSIGIMLLPLYDTARVMLARMIRRQSPFKADHGHVHHKLLALHYTHAQATMILTTASIFFIMLSLCLQHIGIIWLMFVNVSVATALYLIPITSFVRKTRRRFRRKHKVAGQVKVYTTKHPLNNR